MSYTNKTTNFELPQYIASDKPSYLGDFNEAMRKIDSQMEENRVSAAEAGTGMAEAQEKLDKAQTDVGNAQTQLNALNAQVTKNENDISGVAANASQAFTDANQANATSQTAVTTASNASAQAQAAQQSVATLNAEVTELDTRVTALEEKKPKTSDFTLMVRAGTGTSNVTYGQSIPGTEDFTITCTSVVGATSSSQYQLDIIDKNGRKKFLPNQPTTVNPNSTTGEWKIMLSKPTTDIPEVTASFTIS